MDRHATETKEAQCKSFIWQVDRSPKNFYIFEIEAETQPPFKLLTVGRRLAEGSVAGKAIPGVNIDCMVPSSGYMQLTRGGRCGVCQQSLREEQNPFSWLLPTMWRLRLGIATSIEEKRGEVK